MHPSRREKIELCFELLSKGISVAFSSLSPSLLFFSLLFSSLLFFSLISLISDLSDLSDL